MKDVLRLINAKVFFPTYCKDVNNYAHKMRGMSGNGKPLNFSEEDKRHIREAIRKMSRDIISQLNHKEC
jgi:hypothetical protein